MRDYFIEGRAIMPEKATVQEWLIPPHVRYSGAWNEISQRISTRSQINSYHSYMIIAIAGVYCSLPDDIGSLRGFLTAILMPFTSTIYVLWYRHNDIIIGILSAYCRVLEEADQHTFGNVIPTWFHGNAPQRVGDLDLTRIQHAALSVRRFSDFATMSICGISPVLSIIEASHHDRSDQYYPWYVIGAVIACISLFYIVYNIR